MLILKRRPRQAIQIGNDITITVLGIEAGAVILGVSAPTDQQITRTIRVVTDERGAPPAEDVQQ